MGCLPDLGDGVLAVSIGDHRALAEALMAVLGNDPRRIAMGEAARRVAVDRFDIAATSDALLDRYERLFR